MKPFLCPFDRFRLFLAVLSGVALALAPSSSSAAKGECGQPSSGGSGPSASDALFTLKAAIGGSTCELCVCDVTNDSTVGASDALKILKKAVGQSVTLSCPACEVSLGGVVWIPDGTSASIPAASVSEIVAVGLRGLVPAGGATVDLLGLDVEGTPILPALATTTTNADGSYSFTPAPDPGSRTIIRATTSTGVERAFVEGLVVNVDTNSEFVVSSALAAVASNTGATLDSLTVVEIQSLDALMRQTDVDFRSVSTVVDAVALLDETTGGVYDEYVREFATGSGPAPALAGNFHLLTLGTGMTRTFVPVSGETPSINNRSFGAFSTGSPLVVAGDESMSQSTISGRRFALTEISGSTPGSMEAINASATLGLSEIHDTPAASTGTMLASDHGALLLKSSATGLVSPGILADGSDFAVVPVATLLPGPPAARGTVVLAMRHGQSLSDSSLSGTYSAVEFEIDLDASSNVLHVQRSTQARTITTTFNFDGNGHASRGATGEIVVGLSKNGPPPGEQPADPDIVLTSDTDNDDVIDGLDYALAVDGSLTITLGEQVVAEGAVSPDTNLLVLRTGKSSPGSASAGFLIAVKRGSGMNTASGSGTYRLTNFELELQHDTQAGVPDVSPYSNQRAVSFLAEVGSLELDGAGLIRAGSSVLRMVSLNETSYVEQHAAAPDVVRDADVAIFSQTENGADDDETHTYSVASNGVVTVDAADNGGTHGYLSPDGKVFVLPTSELDEAAARGTGLLIGLREP